MSDELKSIGEMQDKNKLQPVKAKTNIVVNVNLPVEKTLSEEFAESLNSSDLIIFNKIKDVLLNTCLLYDYEAFDEDNIKDMPNLIKYFKHGILIIEDDGISIKLRKELILDSKKVIGAKSLIFLFKHNEARETQFTKFIKFKPGDLGSQKDLTRATICAYIKSVEYDGKQIMISPKKLREVENKDYEILTIIFSFFR